MPRDTHTPEDRREAIAIGCALANDLLARAVKPGVGREALSHAAKRWDALCAERDTESGRDEILPAWLAGNIHACRGRRQ